MTRSGLLARCLPAVWPALCLAFLAPPRLGAAPGPPQGGAQSPALQSATEFVRADKTAEALDAVHQELQVSPTSTAAATLLDSLGATAEAQRVFRAALAAATDPTAKAAIQRQLALSYAFVGDCANTARNEQLVIDYWVTRESVEPANAFYQEGEVANEAARVCIDNGNLDVAEQWYRKGTELGLKEPAPQTHPQSLWEFRLAHALGRLAARRGDAGEAKRQVAAARRALDADPTMAAQQERFFPYLTGYVALFTNDFKAAETDLLKATSLPGNQTDPFLVWLLATTYDREGRAAEAKTAYRKAYDLTATAHNPPAAFVRPFVRRRLGLGATRADVLRGDYDRYRANNHVTSYHLDIRVDPGASRISGKNTITFKMLTADTRIQLDLYANLAVDKILYGTAPLKYTRELNTVFVDFPEMLAVGREYAIEFFYSGTPVHTGRFGGFTFKDDRTYAEYGTWIYTACEGEGASLWWPNKDQWHDEVDSMEISVAIPNDLVDVSNGRFQGKTDLGDGYTRWDWLVHYPINNYDVSLNIGHYEHFADTLGGLTLDFYAMPQDLDKAKTQFAQAKGMIEAYQHYFGEYPFIKDGYKLVQVPYTGMEHQSAVTYGNGFTNGYGNRDWTGVGISPKFDFIIIHESGHEWFGNAVSAADVSDMWIHEGWTTYLECLYVEFTFGHDDYVKYTNGYKTHVQNREPIITFPGLHREPPQDMYFKGALMLHTLRSVLDDEAKWATLLHAVFQQFKYKNIRTTDLVAFVNQKTGLDLTAFFDEYLRHATLPQLDLAFNATAGTVAYRWSADEMGFAMPIRVGLPDHWQIIHPTTRWQTMKTALTKADFQVATDLYYVNVSKFDQTQTSSASTR
jgi:tetratricopeptide (TPR) repeat protein